MAPAAWLAFADTVLAIAALQFRLDRGEPPRDFAGVVVGDDEIDNLVEELPGLRRPSIVAGEPIHQMAEGLAAARAAFEESLAAPDELFGAMALGAGMTTEEAEVFAVICGVDLDLARQSIMGYLNDNVSMRNVTLGVLGRIFTAPHPGPAILGPDGALRRAALVSVEDVGPWATRTVAPASTVSWALVGDRSLDPGLPQPSSIVVPGGHMGDRAVVLVSGGDMETRRTLAYSEAAAEAFLVTPMPSTSSEWSAVVCQASVAGTAVLVEVPNEAAWDRTGARVVERTPHLVWAVSSQVELPVESLPERPHHEVIAGDTDDAILRGSHALDAEQARLADLTAAGRRGDWDGAVRRLSGGHLDELAVRIRPRRSWDDLVLASDQLTQVREMVARYRGRQTVYGDWCFPKVPSSGITALFSGPSGTGKTMTAEVIAADLGLDLYRIDLSTVVSKYIGETEKNLERIFTMAAAGNVVLFFDEADALFGKRSAVADAHDRYANIEVSYLLQRLEQYDGVVVLATNLRKNMDDAFLRRIDVSVEYDLPEPDQRRAIWERSFPAEAPLDPIDFGFLAERFDVSGGTITNAALAAAFAAAEDGVPIGMEHVVLGMKREFQKLGRLRTESEFDRYLDVVNGDRHVAPAG